MAYTRVENTQDNLLTLPEIRGADGKTHLMRSLIPGGNNLEEGHVTALDALAKVAKPTGPGEAWKEWLEWGWIKIDRTKGATKKPEGPPAPKTLAGFKPDHAEALIAVESDVPTLRSWLKGQTTEAVIQQIHSRLATLGE